MFAFIKDCLLTYNYPLAHSMTEEEIADIFKISNRCFLISWMLKLLDSAYEEVLENSETDKQLLSSFVYELGLCAQKEKLPFMTGELPVAEQVKIIFNIFTFITDIKKCKHEESKLTVSTDELTVLINTDLNLFPMYGDIKLLMPSEKNLKLSEMEKEIGVIKTAQSNDSKIKDMHLLDNNFKEEIQEFLETLKLDFPKIKTAIENVNKNREMESHNIIELKPNSIETLKNCAINLKIISQFIKDINTIEDFEKNDIDLIGPNRNNITYEMVKALHRDILTVLKCSRCL